MRVTGRQTIIVFQRYRIVSDDEVRAALERTQAAGHKSGHTPTVVIHSRGLSR